MAQSGSPKMTDIALTTFETRSALTRRVADYVEARLKLAVSRDGMAEFAVSGGSTPKPLYEMLAARSMFWEHIRVRLVDERWVPIDDEGSNEAFVRRAFAQAEPKEFVGLYNGAQSPAEGMGDLRAHLPKREKPIDVAIMGLGPDGHTASWFPHAKGLDEALTSDEEICAVTAIKSAVTGDRIQRATMTLNAIRDARDVILMITGEEKRDAFFAARDDGPVDDMPVRALFKSTQNLWVVWAP